MSSPVKAPTYPRNGREPGFADRRPRRYPSACRDARVGMRSCDLVRPYAHFRARLGESNARLQPPDSEQPVALPTGEPSRIPGDLLRHGHGDPKIRLNGNLEPLKSRRHHSHDTIFHAVQQKSFPNHVGVGAQRPAPERVRNCHHRLRPRSIIGRRNRATDCRPYSQSRKEIAGYDLALNHFSVALSVPDHPLGISVEGDQSGESLDMVAVIEVVRIGQREEALDPCCFLVLFPNLNQSLG
jgi:hypothetical protein